MPLRQLQYVCWWLHTPRNHYTDSDYNRHVPIRANNGSKQTSTLVTTHATQRTNVAVTAIATYQLSKTKAQHSMAIRLATRSVYMVQLDRARYASTGTAHATACKPRPDALLPSHVFTCDGWSTRPGIRFVKRHNQDHLAVSYQQILSPVLVRLCRWEKCAHPASPGTGSTHSAVTPGRRQGKEEGRGESQGKQDGPR